MLAVALALVAAATALPPAAQALVGTYATHQMEMAGGLELTADGRFRYMLSYGAIDETGAGEWALGDGVVRLTSSPMPRPPRFVLVRDDPAPAGELDLTLEPPGFNCGGPLDALATIDQGAPPVRVRADETGRVDLGDRPMPIAIRPLIPIYGPAGEAVPIAPARGHKLLFRFEPNDLGQVAFEREPLAIDGDTLIITRWDTMITFRRERQ